MKCGKCGGPPLSASRKGLFGSHWDFWLLGGGSLILWLILASLHLSGAVRLDFIQQPLLKFFALIALLDLAVNLPHFFISYRLAYFQGGGFIWRNQLQLFWVPLLLIAILMLSTFLAFEWPALQPFERPIRKSLRKLGFSGLNSGYLMLAVLFVVQYTAVGWHYSKQAFGVALFRLRAVGQPLSGREITWLKTSLMCVWLSYFTLVASGNQTYHFGSLTYTSLGLSPVFYWAALFLLPLSLGANIWVLRASAQRHQLKSLDLAACGSIFSVYCWFAPPIYLRVPGFFETLSPFFHSVQYLAFACRYEINSGRQRKRFRLSPAVWTVLIYLLTIGAGAFLFRFVPATLDVNYPAGLAGFFALQAYLFLNLHHYWIDNAIWRHSNPEIRTLLKADQDE